MPTSIPSGRIPIGLICCVCTVLGSTLEARTDVPKEIHHQALDHNAYERQRRDAHARLAAAGLNTMDASTPSPPTTFSDHSQIQPRTMWPKTEFQTSAAQHPGSSRIEATAQSVLASNRNLSGPVRAVDHPDGLLDRAYEDPDHLARTWVVVLAYLMMDYRYLYL